MARRAANREPVTPQQHAGRSSRPGAEALSAAEKKERRQALRMGRGLNLRVTKLVNAMVAAHEKASDKLAKGAFQGPDEKRALESARMTNMDILALYRDAQDRYGQPRRTQTEIDLEAAPPLLVKIDGGLPWPAPQGAARDRAAR